MGKLSIDAGVNHPSLFIYYPVNLILKSIRYDQL